MRLAILSANLGSIDPVLPWVDQAVPGYEVEVHRWDDASFPRRHCMSPRLQARIPKMFGWQMAPGDWHDLYVWVDACYSFEHPGAAEWLVRHLGDADFACFAHPDRHSIREENEFIKGRIAQGNAYICSRYLGELGDEEVREILATPGYVDERLYASGILIYRDTMKVRAMLTEWWVHTSRYHVVDQLGLPFVLWKHDVRTRTLPGDYYAPKPYFKRWKHHA